MRTAMTMDRIEHYRGKPVYSSDGDKIGSVDHVYYNVDTNEPEWVAVGAGILSNRYSMVPLKGARFDEAAIVVPFTKEHVKHSPDVAPDALSRHLEKELYSYYSEFGEWGRQFGDPYREPARPVTDPVYGEARVRRWQWQRM
jgi:sporulation protein YlmC with PRC-barrel domain